MANLKEHLINAVVQPLSPQVDRIIRISDKGCFSAKIVAETVKQGFDLIASMKLYEQYINLLQDAMLQGHHFTLLDYLSQNQARKKVPSEQDRYYGMDVKSSLTYGIKEYPMRFIFVRSVRKAHQRQRLMDGKVKRDRNRREKQRAKIFVCVVLINTDLSLPPLYPPAHGGRHIWTSTRQTKIEAEIQNIKEKVGTPYYRDAKKLQSKIDKLCQRYKEGKHMKIELLIENGKAISFSYNWDKAALEKEARLDGIYLLATTIMERPIGTVFELFKEQHYSESANKDLKGPLRIRPIFLQNQGRIEALIFILFLSLMVYMFLERWYRNSVTEPKQRKTTTRTLLSFFRNYALTIMVSEDGIQEIPNSFSFIQHTIFSVLGLEFREIYHKFT